MSIKIEIDEHKLKEIIYEYLERKLGDTLLKEDKINILVKSKQNYKSEWEKADFKALYEDFTF